MNVLSWYENLPKDDVPPEHLWEDGEGLELWWERVERKRNDASSGRSEIDDDDDDQDSGMAENDYARFFKD